MQHKVGNNTYKDRFAKILQISKQAIDTNSADISAKAILLCMKVLQKTKDIKDVLELEAICLDVFDRNIVNNNINKIDGRIVSCQTALDEYAFFANHKEKYLERFLASNIKDIKTDSAFERATKDISRHLGTEKKSATIKDFVSDFYNLRQQKIYSITMAFKKERIDFLEKHSDSISKNITIQRTEEKTKSKNKGFERQNHKGSI